MTNDINRKLHDEIFLNMSWSEYFTMLLLELEDRRPKVDIYSEDDPLICKMMDTMDECREELSKNEERRKKEGDEE